MTHRDRVIWLAGLLEGEGCFAVAVDKRSNRRPKLVVRLKMTDQDVVERAHSVLPGAHRVTPAPDSRVRHSDCWQTAWTGAHAELVMTTVLPSMGERRATKIRECLATPNLSHTPRKVSA